MMLLAILLLGLGIRLYRLDEVPGALWGDVLSHIQRVEVIRSGDWWLPSWFGGDGPVFSYLAALVTQFAGLDFWGMKLTTVLIGTALIPGCYVYAKAVTNNKRVALIAAYLAAVSFWAVSHSRQAKPYILVAVMVSYSLWLLVKKRYVWAGLLIGLGMYVQAAFWGMALLSLHHWQSAVVTAVLTASLIVGQPTYFISSNAHIGSKLGLDMTFEDKLIGFGENVYRNFLSFFLKGDPGFRSSIPHNAHLDWMSAFFFATGLFTALYWIAVKKQLRIFWYAVLPLVLVQIPSMLDVANSQWGPNIGRMIGVLPMVFLLIAIGIHTLFMQVENRGLGQFLIATVLILIGALNWINYFKLYPAYLPDKNLAFDRRIAEHITQRVDTTTPILMVGCCWGEWGQPEPSSVKYNGLPEAYSFSQLSEHEVADFGGGNISIPSALVIRPDDNSLLNELSVWFSYTEQVLYGNNIPVARIVQLTGRIR